MKLNLSAEQNLRDLQKAAGSSADLVHFEDHRIQITVHQDLLDQLRIAGFFAFFPELVPGAGPVSRLAAFQGFVPGFFIDLGQHQHFIGFPVL